MNILKCDGHAMTDPGFPVGGTTLVGGGANSRDSYLSKILYIKTKECGPLGGHAPAVPPGSTTVTV